MGIERRRSPRYPVTGMKGLLHVTFSARFVSLQEDSLTLEATRQLRVGRSYMIGGLGPDECVVMLMGTVTSCRFFSIRTGVSGDSASVYEAVIHLQRPKDGATGEVPNPVPSHLQEALTIDAAYEATVRVLNAYGALIETELELMIGSPCRLELRLGEHPFASMASVVFLHPIKQGDASAFHLGVEYHHTPAASREVYDRFLATLAT